MNRDEAERMMVAMDADAPRAAAQADDMIARRGGVRARMLLPLMASFGSLPMIAGYSGSVPGRIVKTKRKPNARTMAKRRHSKREARRVAELARAVAARKAGQP